MPLACPETAFTAEDYLAWEERSPRKHDGYPGSTIAPSCRNNQRLIANGSPVTAPA